MKHCIFLVGSLKEWTNVRLLFEEFESNPHPDFKTQFSLCILPSDAKQLIETISLKDEIVFILAQLNDITRMIIEKFSKANVFYVDHGVAFIKHFIIEQCKNNQVIFLLSGNILPRLYQLGNPTVKVEESFYPTSKLLLSNPIVTREEFCLRHNLNAKQKIVLFCPTWIPPEMKMEPNHPFWSDSDASIRILEKYNTIMITHPDGVQNKFPNANIWRNDGNLTCEAMKHADVMVSDTSSVMLEFASLGKPVIQMVLTHYADNPSLNYKLPIIPLIDRPFPFGLLTNPTRLEEALKIVIESPHLVESLVKEQKRISDLCGIKKDAVLSTVEKIKSICNNGYISKHLEGDVFSDLLKLPRILDKRESVVITFGTYDCTHVGHFNIFTRAKKLGTKLIVGVSSDDLNKRKKNRLPIMTQEERIKSVEAFPGVDHVFVEEALELKRHYLLYYQASVLVMGDDWEGRMDEFKDICNVVYLPRTPGISTTEIIARIKGRGDL